MNESKNNDSIKSGYADVAERAEPGGQSESRDFAALLGSVTSGRLEVVRGVSRATIHVDPSMRDLYRAHFEGPVPGVSVQWGTVTIKYRRFSLSDWVRYALFWDRHMAEITLNGSIPWQIEIRGGVSDLTADLSGLQLSSLEVRGGASEIVATLPQPSGTVSVRVSGGASNVTLHRPVGIAARVHVSHGASKLTLDEQHFGAIGGDVRLETPDYHSTVDRYTIDVLAGASNLTIDTR
jgi:hypothetical protein